MIAMIAVIQNIRHVSLKMLSKFSRIGLVDSKEFSLAPDGCLSFHPQIAGDIKTFNFDHAGCYR